MTATLYRTGAHPDRDSSRERDATECNFYGTAAPLVVNESDFVQRIAWIRDQPQFPNCVGQSVAACVDATLPVGSPWASGVSLWRDARRRQGRIEEIDIGTRSEYAVTSLVERGWDPYRDGEDVDVEEAGLGAPRAGDDLADEMAAYDNMQPRDVQRYRIIGAGTGLLDALDEALRRGWGVVLSSGLLPTYFAHVRLPEQPDQILGTDYMGGSRDNHAQRLFGRKTADGRRAYYLQNSWTSFWGGCHAPDGEWLRGCVIVDEDVIIGAHDVHVLEVRSGK